MKIKLLGILVGILCLSFIFVSCPDDNNDPTIYTVSWNFNGGTAGVNAQHPTQIEKGTVLAKPTPDPTKTDNTFAGWYSNEGLTTEYNFSNSVNSNLTLYAKWNSNNGGIEYWSITWHFNGGTVNALHPPQIVKGETLSAPTPDPSKENCIFEGWFTDTALTQEYNFTNAVNGNLTLYAKWLQETPMFYWGNYIPVEGTHQSTPNMNAGVFNLQELVDTRDNSRMRRRLALGLPVTEENIIVNQDGTFGQRFNNLGVLQTTSTKTELHADPPSRLCQK